MALWLKWLVKFEHHVSASWFNGCRMGISWAQGPGAIWRGFSERIPLEMFEGFVYVPKVCSIYIGNQDRTRTSAVFACRSAWPSGWTGLNEACSEGERTRGQNDVLLGLLMGLPWCWNFPRLCWQTWNKNNWSNQRVVEVVNPLYHWRKPDGRRRKREKRRSPARSWSARDGSPMVSRDGWDGVFRLENPWENLPKWMTGVTPDFFANLHLSLRWSDR